jgi:hypothetical protein
MLVKQFIRTEKMSVLTNVNIIASWERFISNVDVTAPEKP